MALRTPLSVTPHLYMGDSTGRPLDKGVVYFGEQDKDPEFYPINLFSDDALTKPLAQPVHTKGGYLYDKGDMVEPHAKELIYSVKVLDSYGRKVFYKGAMMRNSWNDDVIEQINAAIIGSADVARQVATDITNDAINNTAIEGGVLADTFVVVDGSLSQRTINKGLESIADLSTIKNPKNGLRVYVKSYHVGLNKGGGYFTYDATKDTKNDGGIVINGWVRAKQSSTLSLDDFGGIADYRGIPLYDGNDESRISGTDITDQLSNLLHKAVEEGYSTVRIPKGHYYIKKGKVAIQDFESLTIEGDGIENTVLDVVKEIANDARSGDLTEWILQVKNAKALTIKNLTIKASTKAGYVGANPLPGNQDPYLGSVSGIEITNVNKVFLDTVGAHHFNQNGYAIRQCDECYIDNCIGSYNVNSGFNLVRVNLVIVRGGVFSYNGIYGNTGTGYGVTGSHGIERMLVSDAYFHNNYRKGLDTHGAASFIVKDCHFADNVLYQVAAPSGSPPSPKPDNRGLFSVTGCTFERGASEKSRQWLKDAWIAIKNNGFSIGGSLVELSDTGGTGSLMVFSNNTVTSLYNGWDIDDLDTSTRGIALNIGTGSIVVKGNYIDGTNLKLTTPSNMENVEPYASTLFGCTCDGLIFEDNYVNFPVDYSIETVANGSTTGSFISGAIQGTSPISILNNTLKTKSARIFQGLSSTAWIDGFYFGATGEDFSFFKMSGNTLITETKRADPIKSGWFPGLRGSQLSKSFVSNNIIKYRGRIYDFPHGRSAFKQIKTLNTAELEKALYVNEGKVYARLIISEGVAYSNSMLTLTINHIGSHTPIVYRARISSPAGATFENYNTKELVSPLEPEFNPISVGINVKFRHDFIDPLDNVKKFAVDFISTSSTTKIDVLVQAELSSFKRTIGIEDFVFANSIEGL